MTTPYKRINSSSANLLPRSVAGKPESRSATSFIEKKVTSLREVYEFGSAVDKIEKFVRAYSHLVDFLLDAYKHVQAKFPEATIKLTVDVESSAKTHEAFIRVTPHIPFPEARQRLDEFDDAWWIKNLDRGDGRITLVVR
ncbi:hypothetical protein [Herpetosiphon geysericola]|nr:hypothetical protein [Herpetosiphon geysericola]